MLLCKRLHSYRPQQRAIKQRLSKERLFKRVYMWILGLRIQNSWVYVSSFQLLVHTLEQGSDTPVKARWRIWFKRVHECASNVWYVASAFEMQSSSANLFSWVSVSFPLFTENHNNLCLNLLYPNVPQKVSWSHPSPWILLERSPGVRNSESGVPHHLNSRKESSFSRTMQETSEVNPNLLMVLQLSTSLGWTLVILDCTSVSTTKHFLVECSLHPSATHWLWWLQVRKTWSPFFWRNKRPTSREIGF